MPKVGDLLLSEGALAELDFPAVFAKELQYLTQMADVALQRSAENQDIVEERQNTDAVGRLQCGCDRPRKVAGVPTRPNETTLNSKWP